MSQCPPGVPLSLSGASVPIDQSVRNWLESVRHSWSTSEWVSALGGLSTSWWNSYRVSRLMLAYIVHRHVYTLLTFKRHPSRVLILGNISAFHIDPSTVASSVHRCPPVGHRECPLWARSPIGVPSASAVARHCAVVTSIRRNIHIFGVHLSNIALHCFTILHMVSASVE